VTLKTIRFARKARFLRSKIICFWHMTQGHFSLPQCDLYRVSRNKLFGTAANNFNYRAGDPQGTYR
jgi:hypothetical protein